MSIQCKFLEKESVKLMPDCVGKNNFHYGDLDDPELFGGLTGTVLKSEYDRHQGQMSYLIEFEKMQKDNLYWFLESELYRIAN